MAADPTGLNAVVKESLDRHLGDIEKAMDRDAVAVYGPIVSGLDLGVRDAIEALDARNAKKRIAVILDTPGGSAEVVERMVDTIRSFYDDVAFVIPDKAMSAGTIFAMSGDSIHMDYFSRLGPIDPQIWKEDRFVPALSYLIQYERLLEKDRRGELTNAEFALLSKFDLAELHQFEQARALSITLLKKWLASYKFKNWTETQTKRTSVTPEMRVKRAEDIATALSDNTRWHSHGRGISRFTLESDDIKLKIDDLAAFSEADSHSTDLRTSVRKYHHCLSDYMRTVKAGIFVHSRAYF
ncbi:MAG: ATP-dependent Clp protease proteolytic subunit [Phycisphaerae bacterium]|nr:ATP-dependent Clp protease proteolytic subunit [Phycisphaerae bacterium]